MWANRSLRKRARPIVLIGPSDRFGSTQRTDGEDDAKLRMQSNIVVNNPPLLRYSFDADEILTTVQQIFVAVRRESALPRITRVFAIT